MGRWDVAGVVGTWVAAIVAIIALIGIAGPRYLDLASISNRMAPSAGEHWKR